MDMTWENGVLTVEQIRSPNFRGYPGKARRVKLELYRLWREEAERCTYVKEEESIETVKTRPFYLVGSTSPPILFPKVPSSKLESGPNDLMAESK